MSIIYRLIPTSKHSKMDLKTGYIKVKKNLIMIIT